MCSFEFRITLLTLLFSTSVSYGTSSCELVLNGLQESSLALAKNSPSKLLPVFRIIHDDFAEKTNDGLAYLNLANTDWKAPIGGKIKVTRHEATKESPEAYVTFQGTAADSNISIQASKSLRESDYGIFNDRPRVFGDATNIRIRVSSSNPEIVHTIRIGDKKPFDISFKAPKVPTDLIIQIPKNNIEYDRSWSGVPVSLIWQSNQKIKLNVFGPIVFERNLQDVNSYAFEHMVSFQYADRFADNHLMLEKRKANVELLKLATANLFKKENIAAALAFAEKGPTAVVQELHRLELGFHFLREKIEVSNFFVRAMPRSSRFGQLRIPVETGEFATEHGALSHGLQLIAMTRGMTPEQTHDFLYGTYDGIFDRPTELWRIWDSLFDAPGDSLPTSPMWWRKQLELRGIPDLTVE